MKITIIGAGKVGFETAKRLCEEGHDILVVDKDESKLARVDEQLDVMILRGNGATAQVLRHPHVVDSELLLAVTDSDEVNIIAGMTGKKLGIKKSIVRVRDPHYAMDSSFSREDLGLDLIINPELAAAREIVRMLTMALPVHTEPFGQGKVQMADITVDEGMVLFVNKRIKDLDMPPSCLIVAISRRGDMIVPGGMDFILPGDTLYILGLPSSIDTLVSKVKKRRQKRIHTVIILGGGRLAYYLADKLCSLGMSVKVIEQNYARCQELAERLPNALILNGDGTDVDLLKREGIEETDGFVAVTGLDEENLLISLLAKQMGAKMVVAKVSRASYAPIVESLGVDAAVSPRLITASEIVRFIQGGRLLSLFMLLNGKAEVVELIVPAASRVVGKPLAKCGLPKNVIVGAILREDRAIIPEGTEKILAEDRIVVFALGHTLNTIEKLFDAGGK
ncbi:Trk system potassium transporter TrkA [Desulforamulus hydrothermalis]|uniref:Trk system potassium uptake protein TrkA n=1 Tax=Desulforamulus hydrothermalis Lam5 = DSM 18033 TaxID=1121428 RepID=K8DZ07_9FIRM|nr:Trk system potassium transporter TrkA [Desulforamulus hydrothermalis]CCO08100.1 Trk system potassium uptake protein trkA homolog 2 [Desulforamulus hydrothermalis Lam5 = DSM 18033]SHG82008.1 trk system potassium uptake protein TrkA [Desulforamulus hydrothermalis Lam5 = DSM 18033]